MIVFKLKVKCSNHNFKFGMNTLYTFHYIYKCEYLKINCVKEITIQIQNTIPSLSYIVQITQLIYDSLL